jgi:predicted phage terminase large subunit-like protein
MKKINRRDFIKKTSNVIAVTSLLNSTWIDEYDLLRSITDDSFYEFVKEFWDCIIPEKPVYNWHIKYLCNEAQTVIERVIKGEKKLYDLIINVSPGSTKSTIFSVMLPGYIWTKKPSLSFIGGSYSSNLALDLGLRNRDLILSEKYLDTYPNVRLRPDQSAKSEFMNTKRGKRISVGVGGSITGKHGDIIVIDDPLDPTRAVSETSLETANKWMSGTLPTRKKDKAITPTILIMQRLHQNDCSANMIERARKAAKLEGGKPKIKHICIPAEITDKIKPPNLRSFYKNGLMDPIRLSRSVLNEAQAEGDYIYSGQFLQWPIPAGGLMFETEKITLASPPRHWKMRVRFWDNAVSKNKRAAYTVGVLMGRDEYDIYWILDVIRKRLKTGERETLKKKTAQLDGKEIIIGIEQEPGSAGVDQAVNTVKNLAGYRVKVVKPTGDKVVRADAFSVQVNFGNVRMVPAEWNSIYTNELDFFPESTYKDQVDASSGAFNLLAAGKRRVGAAR